MKRKAETRDESLERYLRQFATRGDLVKLLKEWDRRNAPWWKKLWRRIRP